MTGAIITGRPLPPVLPALPGREPKLSAPLADLTERMANPHPDTGVRGVVLPKFLRPETEEALARYEHLALPGPEGLIMDWLTGVNLGMAQPLAAKELAARATEIIPALSSLPASVFTSDTRREAQITFDWFPGIKELNALLSRHAQGILSKRRALAALLETDEEIVRPPKTPEEIAAIHAMIEAEFPETPVVEREGPKASYLSRAQLRELYRRQAADADPLVAKGGRLRLRMLGEDAPEAVRETVAEPIPEQTDNPW